MTSHHEDLAFMTDAYESPLLGEPWISFSQAAKLFPPARRERPVSGSCIWRWFRHGVRTADGRRVKLDALLVVNRYVTSAPAVRRFILAMQPVAAPMQTVTPMSTTPRTSGQRSRASERASRTLERLGL
jgi:hypothetical protein